MIHISQLNTDFAEYRQTQLSQLGTLLRTLPVHNIKRNV